MSCCCPWLKKGKGGKKKMFTILIIGIDNSGKTTLAKALKGDLNPETVPTVGQSAPVTKHLNGNEIRFYDLGGGRRIRGMWSNYFSDVHAAIYVIDSADPARFEESKAELDGALEHRMLVGKPILILSNKNDLAGHVAEVEVSQSMGLDKMVLSRHKVVECSAHPAKNGGKMDDRIWEGVQWLCKVIDADYNLLSDRVEKEMAQFREEEKERRARPPPKPETKADDTIYCTVCKEEPAVRRCAAAKWEAVCEPCGQRLEAELAAKAAGAEAGDAESAAPSSSAAVAPSPEKASDAAESSEAKASDADADGDAAAAAPPAPAPAAAEDEAPAASAGDAVEPASGLVAESDLAPEAPAEAEAEAATTSATAAADADADAVADVEEEALPETADPSKPPADMSADGDAADAPAPDASALPGTVSEEP